MWSVCICLCGSYEGLLHVPNMVSCSSSDSGDERVQVHCCKMYTIYHQSYCPLYLAHWGVALDHSASAFTQMALKWRIMCVIQNCGEGFNMEKKSIMGWRFTSHLALMNSSSNINIHRQSTRNEDNIKPFVIVFWLWSELHCISCILFPNSLTEVITCFWDIPSSWLPSVNKNSTCKWTSDSRGLSTPTAKGLLSKEENLI